VNLRYLLFPFLLLLNGALLASPADAEKRLKTTITEVISLAESASNNSTLATSLRPVLLNMISFDAMTRRAVGPGWRQFTEEQQKEATRLFTTLIIRTYSGKFTPGQLPEITYKAVQTPAPGRVEVPTTIFYKGSHYEVTYRMEDAEKGRITDVIIEGVSLVANYRSQFDGEFKQGGASAVVAALREAVATP
jgi:phospholipid transport system substrate-binding protein